MHSVPDAMILCGGAGLRLRTITGDNPKPMAQVANRPFLELLLRQLQRNSFRRAILAVGYRKEIISSYFGNRFCELDLIYSDEPFPLGTGGALRKAADLIVSDTALVMNGDSYTDTDLNRLVMDHHDSSADASLLLVKANGRSDCGSVLVGSDGWIKDFKERASSGEATYLNAGIYVLAKPLLLNIPVAVRISIENELFPKWLSENKMLRAAFCSGECIDIGTPERYHAAQIVLARAELN